MESASARAASEKEEISTESRHDKNEQRCEKDEEVKAHIEERKTSINMTKKSLKDVSKNIKRCIRDTKREKQRNRTRYSKYWKNSKESIAFRRSNQRGRKHSFQKYVTKRMKIIRSKDNRTKKIALKMKRR